MDLRDRIGKNDLLIVGPLVPLMGIGKNSVARDKENALWSPKVIGHRFLSLEGMPCQLAVKVLVP